MSERTTISEQDHISELLAEARAYGLEYEVQEAAHGYLNQGYSAIEAYEMGFNEWIK